MADLAHATENDNDLHGDTDARHWAERFASMFDVRRLADIGHRGIHEPLDTEGLMLTWFAAAIETGRMAGYGQANPIGWQGAAQHMPSSDAVRACGC